MGQAKKSHDTLIEWRTGREWPLKCMTVISTWWRLNIRFQRSSGSRTIIKLSRVRRASWVEDSWSYRRDVVGKATSGRKGLWALMSWGPEKMLIRCRKESHHTAEWPLGLRLSSPRDEKDTTLTAIRKRGQNITVMFDLQLPLTRKPRVTLFEPLQIKWEVHIC